MKRNKKILFAVLLLLITLLIRITLFINRPSNDVAPGQSSPQPSTVKSNSEIEYRAVQAKNSEQCDLISGDSVALGPVDEEIVITEQQAEERCRESAILGQFAFPRIEFLLKNHAGLNQ